MRPKVTLKQESDGENENTTDCVDSTGDSDVSVEEQDLKESPDESDSNEDCVVDDEDFYDEEIMLLVDFEMYLNMDDMLDPNVHIKMIGIDSENPIIQVNEEMYRGSYDSTVGTNVFFEKDPERTAALDPVFEKNLKQMYRIVDTSDKVLLMKRIFATKQDTSKDGQPADEEGGPSSSEEKCNEKYEVKMTYEEALNLHLPEGSYPPRHIAEQQNGADLVQLSYVSDPKIEKADSPVNEPMSH